MDCNWMKRKAGEFGPTILRVMVGIVFALHGSQKLFGAFGGHGIEGFTPFIEKLGFPLPTLFAYLAASAEFFGGLALIFGVLTRLATIPMIFTMIIAVFFVHFESGFFAQNGGFEYPLTLMIALISLGLTGPGALALDSWLYKRFCPRAKVANKDVSPEVDATENPA